MRIFILLFLLTYSATINGQIPFSRIYDDPNPTSFENGLVGLVIFDNKILVNSVKICDFDSIYPDCSAIAFFSLNGGNLIQYQELDTLSTFLRSGLSNSTDNIYLSFNYHSDFNNFTNKAHLIEFNKKLEKVGEVSFEGFKNQIFQTRGSRVIGDYVYLYATSMRNANIDHNYVKLIKYNYKNKNIEWEKVFTLGESGILRCDDVQATHDGNLAFILNNDNITNTESGYGYQIVKVNSNGEIIKTFLYEDIIDQNNRLMVSRDGSFYCGSRYHPRKKLQTSSGRINKINKTLDSIEWSLILPHNPLVDGRIYVLENYIEARNGDIVACGKVWDISDSNVPVFDVPNNTYNGFIIRITPEAKVIWLRVYRQPQDLFDKKTFGHFRQSQLNYIVELESGHFLAGGDVEYNLLQREEIYKQKLDVEKSHFWLLLVDENGCLDKNDCNTKIYLTNTKGLNRDDNEIEISPNPVKEKLFIKNSDSLKGNYQILDIMGKGHKSGSIIPEIDVKNLVSGIYFIQLKTKGKNSITLKFIKS